MSANFTMFSGDSRTLLVEIRNEAGDAVDIFTATAVTYALFGSDGALVLTKTLGDGISTAAHIVTIQLLPADTAGLQGMYLHELEIVMADGAVSTVLQDAVTIRKDYIDHA